MGGLGLDRAIEVYLIEAELKGRSQVQVIIIYLNYVTPIHITFTHMPERTHTHTHTLTWMDKHILANTYKYTEGHTHKQIRQQIHTHTICDTLLP